MKDLLGIVLLLIMVLAFAIVAANAMVSSLHDKGSQGINSPRVVGLCVFVSMFTVLAALTSITNIIKKSEISEKPKYEQVTEPLYRQIK